MKAYREVKETPDKRIQAADGRIIARLQDSPSDTRLLYLKLRSRKAKGLTNIVTNQEADTSFMAAKIMDQVKRTMPYSILRFWIGHK